MVNYAKGNLNVLQDYNPFWALIFMFLYYMNISFLMHSAFHCVQTISVIRTSIRTGLSDEQDPFVEQEEEVIHDFKKLQKEKIRKNFELLSQITMWILGWTPRQFLKFLQKLKDKINEELLADSSDDEDEGVAEFSDEDYEH